MKFSPDQIPQKEMVHFNGGENSIYAQMVQAEGVRIMVKGVIPPGASVGLHPHDGSLEVVFILSGHCYALCDGERETLQPGDCHYCSNHSTHTLVNDGEENVVFCAVIPTIPAAPESNS